MSKGDWRRPPAQRIPDETWTLYAATKPPYHHTPVEFINYQGQLYWRELERDDAS